MFNESMTKTEVAFNRLRSDIEEGRIKPGEWLRLHTLIKNLGMSPTPIREALRLLQAQGLVEHHPHHGTIVAKYSPEKVEEVYRLRVVLEPLATEFAAEKATEEQMRIIRESHLALKKEVESNSGRVEIPELNAAWHWAIYSAAGSRHLEEFISRLWNSIPVQAVWLTQRGAASVAQHEEIMKALERRDTAAAAQYMKEHIQYAGDICKSCGSASPVTRRPSPHTVPLC